MMFFFTEYSFWNHSAESVKPKFNVSHYVINDVLMTKFKLCIAFGNLLIYSTNSYALNLYCRFWDQKRELNSVLVSIMLSIPLW